MTLQQLKYSVKIAEKGSMNEAAKALFLAQPSLSATIQDLEKELQFPIFTRSSRGVTVTSRGAEFLGYARQVLVQTELLESKFIAGSTTKRRFCASSHHYLFVANAFVDLVREYGEEAYDFTLNETTTYEVIEHVKTMFSEVGVIYLSRYNEGVLRKILRENNLVFTPLFCAKPHVFLYRGHPLAQHTSLTLAQLVPYPKISFNQGQHNAFYFSEEVLSEMQVPRHIHVSDRAAVVNFMIGLEGYMFSSGVFPKYLHGDDIVAIPLAVDEKIEVGTLVHQDTVLSEIGERFCAALRSFAKSL